MSVFFSQCFDNTLIKPIAVQINVGMRFKPVEGNMREDFVSLKLDSSKLETSLNIRDKMYTVTHCI